MPRSTDRAHGMLDGGYDVTGDEPERRRDAGGTHRRSTARKQEQRQADRRCCECGRRDNAGDRYVQLHAGRPDGRNAEAVRLRRKIARNLVVFQLSLVKPAGRLAERLGRPPRERGGAPRRLDAGRGPPSPLL